MHASSPKQWVVRLRLAIILVGSAWPVAALLLLGPDKEGLVWAAISIAFLGIMFGVPAALLSIFIRTYEQRILFIPVALIAVFWALSSQSAQYDGFNLPPYMMLWIVTATAIALLQPEHEARGD